MLTDTIVAISTPSGRGGIGVVRLSGPKAVQISTIVTARELPKPRVIAHTKFFDATNNKIDEGLILFFEEPNSYTGENVCEFHAHGNPIILSEIVRVCCELGARMARPGEFTERSYRAGKLDLLQAEAVADLISAQTIRAVRSAHKTLEGGFGSAVQALISQTQEIRYQLEAAIDFSEDTADGIFTALMFEKHKTLLSKLEKLLRSAVQGQKLTEGFKLVIVGAPNAGKSMLLNRLVQSDRAIVSAEAGTTRDVINVDSRLRDLPVQIIDTAGLREDADNVIELEGIKRTYGEVKGADLVIYLKDVTAEEQEKDTCLSSLPPNANILLVYNKIDKIIKKEELKYASAVCISALSGEGLDKLQDAIAEQFGAIDNENVEYAARERHVVALKVAINSIKQTLEEAFFANPELVAEDYRHATKALEEIGGQYSTEDLLGDIFSRFCVGK